MSSNSVSKITCVIAVCLAVAGHAWSQSKPSSAGTQESGWYDTAIGCLAVLNAATQATPPGPEMGRLGEVTNKIDVRLERYEAQRGLNHLDRTTRFALRLRALESDGSWRGAQSQCEGFALTATAWSPIPPEGVYPQNSQRSPDVTVIRRAIDGSNVAAFMSRMELASEGDELLSLDLVFGDWTEDFRAQFYHHVGTLEVSSGSQYLIFDQGIDYVDERNVVRGFFRIEAQDYDGPGGQPASLTAIGLTEADVSSYGPPHLVPDRN